jgi:hypothetical protein
MGTTHRFLATVDEGAEVLAWFRSLPARPVELVHDAGSCFHFADFMKEESDQSSCLVNVIAPSTRRNVLTTIGEVHFVATPLSRIPTLQKLNQQFRRWLEGHPCVFSRDKEFDGRWNYYLEGGVQNTDSAIYALPRGMAALESGAYFVAFDDGDSRLEKICCALRLRGVEGIEWPSAT